MAINNKTLSSIQGKVTSLTTNETEFREGIDDTLIQVNATEVLLQDIDSADITKLSEITATSSELNILDGVTASTSEINILDGLTSTTAELNLLDGVTATTAEINILDGLTVSKTELNKLDGFTGTYLDLNKIAAVTATAAELNKLDGFTGNAADLNRTVELDAAGNGTASQVLTSDGLGGYSWTTPSSFTFTLEDEDGTEVSIDTDEIKIIGDGMTIDWGAGDGTDGNPYQLQIDNADKGSSQNIFKNILVSGQSDIIADRNNDSLTLVGNNISITTTAATDTITFGIEAGSGISIASNTISHANTSSQSSINNSGNTFIQDLTFDTYGHVTGATSGSVNVGNATITISAGSGLSGGAAFTTNQSSNETVTLSHADTSSQGSVNNSGNTYVQDITLDTYGHITDINSATVTVPTLTHFGANTNFGNNTVYNLPTDTFMLQGTSYHYMGSNQGSRLDIYVYSSTGGGGTRIQTYIVSGGNELDGTDGGSGMSTRCGWSIVLPPNARSIKFVKGDGARAITGKIEAGMKFTNYFS